MEVTRRCLRHLETLKAPDWTRVLVVEDGCTDGTRAMIEEQFPWVTMFHGTGDLWWAGAIHLGMRHAIKAGATCVCWLNDDCLPDQGTLELLTKTAAERGAVCGALCRGADGSAIAYGGGFMVGGWPAPLKEPLPATDEICVHWLHGNVVAIPADVWQRIGLPECRWMRHNLADIFYTCCAHRCDIPILLLKQATAVAEMNQSLSYRSWADPGVSSRAMLTGLWNPRVWWYAPGLAYFLIALHGWRGLLRLARLGSKLLVLSVLKVLLPGSWIKRLRAFRFAKEPVKPKQRDQK
jgi:GT2 family glycosyltransferase